MKILLYYLCLIVCNASGSVAMATRNQYTNGAYTRSGTHQDSLRNRPTKSTSTDFGKSSLYLLLEICIGIAHRYLVSLATGIRVLKPLENVTHIKQYNNRKTRRAAGIWKIWCWMHILAWINQSCIVVHKLLVLHGSLHYVQCIPYETILQIFILYSMIWYCRIQSPAVSK